MSMAKYLVISILVFASNAVASPIESIIKSTGKSAESVIDSLKGQTRIKHSTIKSKVEAQNARIHQKGVLNSFNAGVKIGKGTNIVHSHIESEVNIKNAHINQEGALNDVNMGVDIK
jgi:cell division septum initiation protein DivIVA